MNFFAINAAEINGSGGIIYYGEGNAYIELEAEADLKQATKSSVKANILLSAKADLRRAIFSNGSAFLSLDAINNHHHVLTYNKGNGDLLLKASGKSSDVLFGYGLSELKINANAKSAQVVLSNIKANLAIKTNKPIPFVQQHALGLLKLILKGKATASLVSKGYGEANLVLDAKSNHYALMFLKGKASLSINTKDNGKLAVTGEANANAELSAKANGERAHFEYGLAELRLISRAVGKAVIYLKGKSNIVLGAFNLNSIIAPTSKGLSELELKSIGNENVIFKPSARSNLELKAIGQYSNSILGHAISELHLTSIGNAVIATIGDAAPSRINMLSSATGKVHVYLFGKSSLKMLANAHLSIILYEHGLVEISLNAKSSGKIAILGSVESLFELMAKNGIPNPPIAPIWFNDAHRSARLKQPTENRSFVIPKDRGKMTVTDNQSIRIQRE